MILRTSFLSWLLVSVITVGLSSSTVNFAAPEAPKVPIDPRFHGLPPRLRERLEKRMRPRPQTQVVPQERNLPLKPAPVWVRQLGTPELDRATAVAVGPQDSIYVTGETEGTLGEQNYGFFDVWLAKYDPGRKLLWKVQLGSLDYDFSDDVAVDGKGYVYITGATYSVLDGSNYFWVAKYNSAGKLQWKKQLGTSAYEDFGGIAADSNGNVYITGLTTGKLGDQQYGGTDAWVAKYDSSGSLQWKNNWELVKMTTPMTLPQIAMAMFILRDQLLVN
jgi:hypothetical protein